MIKVRQAVKHILIREEFQSSEIIKALQDKNKKWVSLLADFYIVINIILSAFID